MTFFKSGGWGLSREDVKRLTLFILVGVLSLVLGRVVFRGSQAVSTFQSTAYWFTTVSVLAWGYAGFLMARSWDWRSHLRAFRKDWPWLGVAMLVTFLAVFVHQQPGLKIVNDEPTQLGTAKSLFETHQAAAVYRAYDGGLGMVPTNWVVDKRPILYAWTVAQVHALTGYRESNGFWVNRVLSVFTTLALFVLGRRIAGAFGGASLSLLMLLAPMQAHMGNSGGFEMMNLLFIVLLGLGLFWYFDHPCSHTESWLALTFVLLAGLRYESVVFVFPVIIAVLVAWRAGHAPRLGWLTQLVPVLLIPRLWLQEVFNRGDSWQLQSKPEAKGDPFGLHFLYENIGHALNYAFSTSLTSTNSILLSALGLGCAVFWLMLLSRKSRHASSVPLSEWAPYVLWFGLSLHLALMMCYFWGQYDDPLTQRLALPTHLWLAVAAVGVISTFKSLRRWYPHLVVVLAGCFLVFTAPQLKINRFYELNHTTRAQNKIREWMQEHPDRHRLVINNVAVSTWLSGDNPSVTIGLIRSMPERIRYQWEAGTFSEILAFFREGYDPETHEWKPVDEDALGPDFDYEYIWTLRCTSVYRFSLVRVTAIRSDHLHWTPEKLTPEQGAKYWTIRNEFFTKQLDMMP